jgi:hypothetical protein
LIPKKAFFGEGKGNIATLKFSYLEILFSALYPFKTLTKTKNISSSFQKIKILEASLIQVSVAELIIEK